MTYHGRVNGPNGQTYYCEHDHRTETAAVRCANSSATRQMAELAWARAAAKAAQAAELARRRAEERQAAEARRVAAKEAEEARRAAAQRAAQEAKAAKRAAKLASMKPERAWKRMTPVERLLRTAENELQVYGEIRSADAKHAYEERARRLLSAQSPPIEQAQPGTVTFPDPKPAAPASPELGSRRSPDQRAPAQGQLSGRPQPACPPESEGWRGFGGDGLYVVGLDIEPGVYRTTGSAVGTRAGYFALLKSTNTHEIINNGRVKGPMTVTIGPGVRAVEVRDCQPWQRLGDDLDAAIQAAASQRHDVRGSFPTHRPAQSTWPLRRADMDVSRTQNFDGIPAPADLNPLNAYPVSGTSPMAGITPEIMALVSRGMKIQAIKLYRQQNPGARLKDAKDIIDQIG